MFARTARLCLRYGHGTLRRTAACVIQMLLSLEALQDDNRKSRGPLCTTFPRVDFIQKKLLKNISKDYC